MKTSKVLDISEFRALPSKDATVRLAQSGAPVVSAETRTVSFVFSDGSVDRYGDTIDAKGWVLDAFNANPIALFGHDAGSVENVIGKAKNVRVQGSQLVGDIEFAEASVNKNAETVFQMIKGGFLNTVSVGFQPLEWVQTKDKSRPGGIDFKKQELMEISVVPVPANPNAVALAKAAGIDVDRLSLLRAAPATREMPITKKGLYSVASLAYLLSDLGWLVDAAEWEAEYEGDGSAVPGKLKEALAMLGQALIDMTIEEVGELLAEEVEGTVEMDFTPVQKFVAAACTAFRKAKVLGSGRKLTEDEIDELKKAWGGKIPFAVPLPHDVEVETSKVRAMVDERMAELGLIKAGKKLSAASQAVITDACMKMMDAHDCLKAMLDEPDEEEPAVTKTADPADIRARKAKALKLKVSTL